MEVVDWIKLGLILPAFLVLGPLLGLVIKDRPRAQDWVFAAMCAMTINGLFGPGNWGLTIDSVEFYRGHAKGYHFYFNHIFAIALIVAGFSRDSRFRWFPPGLIVYLLSVLCCFLSIWNAPRMDYVIMATHKMLFFALIYLATFHWCRDLTHLQFFVRVMAVIMCWQAAVVLKLKYIDGIYQVRGTFEHQNPLAMYAVLIGMPLFAVALGPPFPGRWLCTAGFLSCGLIVQSALSRAALAMFAAGSIAVIAISLAEKPTKRRRWMIVSMFLITLAGLAFTLDTIVARFHDDGNTASSELREVLNEAARAMADDHFLGVGWNNYALVVNEPYPYAEFIYDWIRERGMKVDETKPNAPVESHYYLLLGENGVLGLGSWLLVIGVALLRNVRDFIRFGHSFERVLALGIAVGCSLNYFQSTLERVLTQPRNFMLWLILYGITARLSLLRPASERSMGTQHREDSPGQPPSTPLPRESPAPPTSSGTPDAAAVDQWPVPDWARSHDRTAATDRRQGP